MRRSLILSLVALAVCNAGCQFLPIRWGSGDEAQRTAPAVTESVLYARDGSIVTPGGSASASNLPRRGVQADEGSRAKILELYERVIEERDQLRLSFTAQSSELAQVRQQLDKESSRANEFELRMHSAEQARVELIDQNLDLAGRLTTAQIRRLEAEKKWLELSISLPGKTVAAGNAPSGPSAREKLVPTSTVVLNPAAKPAGQSNEHHR